MLSNYATALLAMLAVAAPAMASVQDGSALVARAKSDGSLGSSCTRNSQCKEFPTGSRASCSKEGKCDFVCLNAPILVKNAKGDGCIPNMKLKSQCKKDSDCDGKVKYLPNNADEMCLYNQCTFQCKDGYHKIAGKCYKNQDTCDGKKCAPVRNGASFCDAEKKCVYRCQQAQGFTLYTNSDKSAYKCINTGTDVNNCGAAGNVCGQGYNGLGQPACQSGTCTVDCSGQGSVMHNSKGQYYCTGN